MVKINKIISQQYTIVHLQPYLLFFPHNKPTLFNSSTLDDSPDHNPNLIYILQLNNKSLAQYKCLWCTTSSQTLPYSHPNFSSPERFSSVCVGDGFPSKSRIRHFCCNLWRREFFRPAPSSPQATRVNPDRSSNPR